MSSILKNKTTKRIGQVTFKDAIAIIENIASQSISFKIGKTELPLEQRLRLYGDEFKFIELIGYSENTETITEWERALIYHFTNESIYKHKCKNIQLGGGSDNSDTLYVVFNKFDFSKIKTLLDKIKKQK